MAGPPSRARPAALGGAFSLIDQHGRRVTDRDFRGHYMLVYFGYTRCPDVCPTSLEKATRALQRLGDRAKAIVPVFVTIDPERDTPKVLADYLSNFHPGFVGLTGRPDEIRHMAGLYHVVYGKYKAPGSADETVFHSSFFYLMGPDGRYRTVLAPRLTAATMSGAIARVLDGDARTR
jgi:protein SCO1/2